MSLEHANEIVTNIGDLITIADANAIAANDQAAIDLAIAGEGFEATAEAKKDEAENDYENAVEKSSDIDNIAQTVSESLTEASDASAAITAAIDSASEVPTDVTALGAIQATIETQMGICETASAATATAFEEANSLYMSDFTLSVAAASNMAGLAESAANSASITLTSAQEYQGNAAQTEALARTQNASNNAAEYAAEARDHSNSAIALGITTLDVVTEAGDKATEASQLCAVGTTALDTIVDMIAAANVTPVIDDDTTPTPNPNDAIALEIAQSIEAFASTVEGIEESTQSVWAATAQMATFTDFRTEAEGYLADAESAKTTAVNYVTSAAPYAEDLATLLALLPVVNDENIACNAAVGNF